MLSRDHELQKANILKVIEHLELAKSYCDLAWGCAENLAVNALSAELEPFAIQQLIDRAESQLAQVGGGWESIECSVCPEREY